MGVFERVNLNGRGFVGVEQCSLSAVRYRSIVFARRFRAASAASHMHTSIDWAGSGRITPYVRTNNASSTSLVAFARELLMAGLKPNTRSTYHTGQKSFLEFCSAHVGHPTRTQRAVFSVLMRS